MRKITSVGILGASGLLGDSLPSHIDSLDEISFHVFQHRTSLNHFKNYCTVHSDLSVFLGEIDVLISFIPIWKLVSLLNPHSLHELELVRIVAVSSTSALTKIKSEDDWERGYAIQFLDSEVALTTLCHASNCSLAIVRPTMIWGSGKDLNISFIQRFISRFGFFILPSYGIGLRWPIHHSDLLASIFALAFRDSDSIYIARGREELSYRELIKRVFIWQHLRPVIFTLPSFIIPFAVFIARVITSKPYINSSSFRRIDCTETQIMSDQNCLLSEHSFQPLHDKDVLRPSYVASFLNKLLSTVCTFGSKLSSH